MKTFITILLIAVCFTSLSNAQSKTAIGAAAVISLPIGTFGEAANLGIGATAAFELKFTPQVAGVGQIGYISYSTESDLVSFTTVPLLAGVKYYFTPGVGFYGIGQLGFNFFSQSVDIPSVSAGGFSFGGGSAGLSSVQFTFAFGAGYEMPVSENFYLDFTGTFQLISNFNNIQLRAGGKLAL